MSAAVGSAAAAAAVTAVDTKSATAASAVVVPATTQTTTTTETHICFLTVNDVYESDSNIDSGLGGMAQFSTLLHTERAKARQHETPHVVTTCNGDFMSASTLAMHHKGKHMIDLLNFFKVDYVVFGNRKCVFVGVLCPLYCAVPCRAVPW